MEEIVIKIKNKIAYNPKEEIVCGNNDYQIKFEFDEEWNAYPQKTARFKYNGTSKDVPFSGDTVQVPKIIKAQELLAGVFTEDLASTDAAIKCKYSCTSVDGLPEPPTEDAYSLIMKEFNKIVGDIDDALDELHEYAQRVIGGGEA